MIRKLFQPRYRVRQWMGSRGGIWWEVYCKNSFLEMWGYIDMFKTLEEAKVCVESDMKRKTWKPKTIYVPPLSELEDIQEERKVEV